MRNEITETSSKIYMNNPEHLRSLKLELIQRSKDNAFLSHPEIKKCDDETRAKAYNKLKNKIRNDGFRPDCPILIMLNRKKGEDKIFQGHHRLSIAIELGLPEVPVQFVCGKDKSNSTITK